MRRIGLLCAALALTGCVNAQPTGGARVSNEGEVTGGVGVETGRVAVGVNTDGDVGAAVDVVQRPNANVTVGTGGASVSVRPGGGRVRVGYGWGGWGVRF